MDRLDSTTKVPPSLSSNCNDSLAPNTLRKTQAARTIFYRLGIGSSSAPMWSCGRSARDRRARAGTCIEVNWRSKILPALGTRHFILAIGPSAIRQTAAQQRTIAVVEGSKKTYHLSG